jgi:hypothetical protein
MLFTFVNNVYVPCAVFAGARADSGRITMLLKVVGPLTLIVVKGSKSPVEVIIEIVGCGWTFSVMTVKQNLNL